jgi:hypothetical protein
VYEVLVPQQFQDFITTAPLTTQAVSPPKSHKEGMSGASPKWKMTPLPRFCLQTQVEA